jgi:hypothetical protein
MVSAAALSHGHNICAANPWVTGFAFTRGTDNFGAAAYHPTQASMDAVAATLDERWSMKDHDEERKMRFSEEKKQKTIIAGAAARSRHGLPR